MNSFRQSLYIFAMIDARMYNLIDNELIVMIINL